MEGNRKGQNLIIAALLVAVVAMSIGFAAYSQSLTINGNVTAKAAKWSVHYDTNTYNDSASTATTSGTPTHSVTNTDWTFTVTLNPGEKYDATMNVVNDGTFDAVLKSVTMSALNAAAEGKYLTYTVYVNGTAYTQTTTGLSVALAKLNGSQTVRVVVEYILPQEPSDLPATDTTVTLSASLDYEQSTN